MDVAFAFQRVARKEIVEVGLVLRLRPLRARAHALEARRKQARRRAFGKPGHQALRRIHQAFEFGALVDEPAEGGPAEDRSPAAVPAA